MAFRPCSENRSPIQFANEFLIHNARSALLFPSAPISAMLDEQENPHG